VKDKEKWSELIANIRSNPPNDQSPVYFYYLGAIKFIQRV